MPWYWTIGWLAAVVAASVVYRLARGKPMFRPRVPDAVFTQGWCSGRSLRNVVTRLGGASGCLWLVVTRDELRVGAHFPLCLMFLPEIYGLECRVAARDVRSVEERRTRFGGRNVRVTFRRPDGDDESFDLQLRDPDGFLRALRSVREPAAPARSRGTVAARQVDG